MHHVLQIHLINLSFWISHYFLPAFSDCQGYQYERPFERHVHVYMSYDRHTCLCHNKAEPLGLTLKSLWMKSIFYWRLQFWHQTSEIWCKITTDASMNQRPSIIITFTGDEFINVSPDTVVFTLFQSTNWAELALPSQAFKHTLSCRGVKWKTVVIHQILLCLNNRAVILRSLLNYSQLCSSANMIDFINIVA